MFYYYTLLTPDFDVGLTFKDDICISTNLAVQHWTLGKSYLEIYHMCTLKGYQLQSHKGKEL